jgi:oxygen-independent coproporphyrinogen-3 oxidase
MQSSFSADLRACAYPGYVYGYPHKKAYRPLAPRPLADVWRDEDARSLYCYVHLPFCKQRCSFCNLFTLATGERGPVPLYLDALARQMEMVAKAIPGARFSRLYIGGGTPTFLSIEELRRLCYNLTSILGVEPAQTHACIEASPETLDAEKALALKEMGFQRLSLGVQSFVEAEREAVNRRWGLEAIDAVGHAGFRHFNIDLIYGLPGQTRESWRTSLHAAIASPATSLFLYPLYVRPLTGLGVRQHSPTPHEMAGMYDDAVGLLAGAGFRQLTMRQFRRDTGDDADEYRCQRHGMVGLGAGARSYTSGLHYSTPWKMLTKNIRTEIEEYSVTMTRGDDAVRFGIELDDDERRRRFVIQSLLYDGLDLRAFSSNFNRDARELFAGEWALLWEERCIVDEGDIIRLSARGMRHADIVGNLFFSERVQALTEAYEYDT